MTTTRARRLGAIAVALAGLIAAGSTAAVAGGAPMGGHGAPGGFASPGNRGGFSFNPSAPFSFNPSAPFSFNPPPRVAPHRHFRRQHGFFGYGGGVYAVPYVSDPGYYYDAPAPVVAEPAPQYTQVVVYTPPPVYPPAVGGSAAPAPARPSVVEFPDGRYELRGDGVNTAYTWVWIPNPPAAPPAPAAPARSASPAEPERSPARRSQLYRWLDDQGVVHLTDRLESIPEEYRQQVKRIGPS